MGQARPGPAVPSGRKEGIGHDAPATFNCRLKKMTVKRPPWGPPPGVGLGKVQIFNQIKVQIEGQVSIS